MALSSPEQIAASQKTGLDAFFGLDRQGLRRRRKTGCAEPAGRQVHAGGVAGEPDEGARHHQTRSSGSRCKPVSPRLSRESLVVRSSTLRHRVNHAG